MFAIRYIAAASLLICTSWAAEATTFPAFGTGEQLMSLKGVEMRVFTYRPRCRNSMLLIVLHGMGRNARSYRDAAIPVAQSDCMFVAAPEFDKQRFASWRYQHGGIVHGGQVQPFEARTGHLVVELARQISQAERKNLSYSLIGHSGGGQFLSRLAAFVPVSTQRIVLTNPGTLVFPSRKINAPYGVGGVYPDHIAARALQRYLAQPVTIFVGQDDVHEKDLDMRPEAMEQGATRYERGINAFRAAQALARSKGWAFNWRLVQMPGVGHSARKMFFSREILEALRP